MQVALDAKSINEVHRLAAMAVKPARQTPKSPPMKLSSVMCFFEDLAGWIWDLLYDEQVKTVSVHVAAGRECA